MYTNDSTNNEVIKLYGCQQILISPSNELKAILEYICLYARKLSDCGIYYARQMFFKKGKILSKFDLINELTNNKHYQALYSQVAQQALMNVAESFKSFKGLLREVRKGNVNQRPRVPNYRKSGLVLVSYPKQAIKLKDGMLRFPLGQLVKTWFKIDSFFLPMPTNLKFSDIKEVRILPRNMCFYVEFVYEQPDKVVELNKSNVLGIDHGINNWLTCVSNIGTSFIVDGKHLKSLNQWYNKQISKFKEGKPQGFWSEKLALITEKRNRQVRDAVNKAARIVINHCIKNNIGTIVFGWNKGQKDGANMGVKQNQKFVQIPTGRLKDRIAQLCEQYGIQFVETEESYTSKSSFLDGDTLPTFGEKPEGWQPSGRRVKRGLYKSSQGFLINADCNGAANIIRKVAAKLGLVLNVVNRVLLNAPVRIRLWHAASKQPLP
ncbi:transposase [Calothrix sp. NIES-4071]|nr:transposase [Calothrix sp. NIES-4071]BAZ56959.1 transposase [Calothrix sp. NIES-4105]